MQGVQSQGFRFATLFLKVIYEVRPRDHVHRIFLSETSSAQTMYPTQFIRQILERQYKMMAILCACFLLVKLKTINYRSCKKIAIILKRNFKKQALHLVISRLTPCLRQKKSQTFKVNPRFALFRTIYAIAMHLLTHFFVWKVGRNLCLYDVILENCSLMKAYSWHVWLENENIVHTVTYNVEIIKPTTARIWSIPIPIWLNCGNCRVLFDSK